MATAEDALEALREVVQALADSTRQEMLAAALDPVKLADATGAHKAYQGILDAIDHLKAQGFDPDPKIAVAAQPVVDAITELDVIAAQEQAIRTTREYREALDRLGRTRDSIAKAVSAYSETAVVISMTLRQLPHQAKETDAAQGLEMLMAFFRIESDFLTALAGSFTEDRTTEVEHFAEMIDATCQRLRATAFKASGGNVQ